MSTDLPSYDEIVDRNSITVLMMPGDLTVRDGNIAMTRWGDLMLNDQDYSAFARLVHLWRYNFPTLEMIFRAVVDSFDDEGAAEQNLNTLGRGKWDPALGVLQGLNADTYHAAIERIEAVKVARGVYAGTITLLLSRALATFRTDIAATVDEWKCAGAAINGHSVGEILEAAANNVRHADEWLTASTATPQQLKSVRVISSALAEPIPASGAIRSFARDISPEILQLLSDRDFLKLEKAVFAFANGLLALRQKRAPSR